jgi:hypothetical protein
MLIAGLCVQMITSFTLSAPTPCEFVFKLSHASHASPACCLQQYHQADSAHMMGNQHRWLLDAALAPFAV